MVFALLFRNAQDSLNWKTGGSIYPEVWFNERIRGLPIVQGRVAVYEYFICLSAVEGAFAGSADEHDLAGQPGNLLAPYLLN